MIPVYDLAALAVCSAMLAASWWLLRKTERQLDDARRHLAKARALREREDPPPRWLYAVDESEPK